MKHLSPHTLIRTDAKPASASTFRSNLLGCEPALRRFARSLGDADFADDLTQAAIARALECEADYTAQGAMLAWLRQIARNLAHDQRKRRSRYDLFSDLATPGDGDDGEERDDFQEALPDETACDPENLIDAKRLTRLAASILPSEMWACLEGTLAGHDSNEIAADLRISPAAVRQNIARGRKALQALRT